MEDGVLLVTNRSGGDAKVWCDARPDSSGMRGIVVGWTGPALIDGCEATRHA